MSKDIVCSPVLIRRALGINIFATRHIELLVDIFLFSTRVRVHIYLIKRFLATTSLVLTVFLS